SPASPSPVNRTLGEKIFREIRRIPRNIRRAVFSGTEPPPLPKPPKLAALPFGSVDHPGDDEVGANNAIQIEGWALDRIQIARVTIERKPFRDDRSINSRVLVHLGQALI